MDKEILEALKGLEVVDTYHKDEGFGILFDDGVVLLVSYDGTHMFLQGTGWEGVWRDYSS